MEFEETEFGTVIHGLKDALMPNYEPACYRCRVEAGKPVAGVKESSLCVAHLRERVAALEAENESLKQKELKRSICGLVNIEDLEEVQQELADLRTKVRRLVAAVGIVTSKYVNMGKTFIDGNDIKRIEQAIAEVEKC